MSKLVKKQTHMLQNGDVIYFVYRKSEPEQSESFCLKFHADTSEFRRRNVSSVSFHPSDIAYVYHSIQTEQAMSQHTCGM